jgi:hypothetical protein
MPSTGNPSPLTPRRVADALRAFLRLAKNVERRRLVVPRTDAARPIGPTGTDTVAAQESEQLLHVVELLENIARDPPILTKKGGHLGRMSDIPRAKAVRALAVLFDEERSAALPALEDAVNEALIRYGVEAVQPLRRLRKLVTATPPRRNWVAAARGPVEAAYHVLPDRSQNVRALLREAKTHAGREPTDRDLDDFAIEARGVLRSSRDLIDYARRTLGDTDYRTRLARRPRS